MPDPSRAIALYGTTEEVAPPRVLRAGKLAVELEAGNLRYLRWDGEEVLRAVSFIVRDEDWGTYAPAIADLEVSEAEDRFRVTYRAEAGAEGGRFAYDATIEGAADGTLTFHGAGRSETGFATNRTGFVVLHPIDGVAGAPVTIEHTGGETVEAAFPELIDPVQPMMDLRALTHRTPGGLTVRVAMEGDTYEMEDQRNWTDASYKTYVRPLARPWPYRIEPGETVEQTVTVTVSGSGNPPAETGAIAIEPGAEIGIVPPLGMGLRPEDADAAADAVDALKALGPSYLVLHFDPRRGHDRLTLAAMLKLAGDVKADPWLEAVIAATDDAGAAEEVAALGAMGRALDRRFGAVLVSPAPDLKCTLPGSEWPAAPDPAALYEATREAFPLAPVGGGMFSYFTELNRKRPPVGHLDLVTFTTSPMVHAGDDRSVMETREAHPAIVATAAAIAGDTPWVVGPSAIGLRDNPYGEAAKDNPGNVRQAMNRNDPRQRGLMGAAWALAYFADFAAGGASGIALGAPTGAFGAIAAPTDDPQPWFDEHGGVYPVFHVLRGVARLRDLPIRAVELQAAGPAAALAVATGQGTELWVANMRAEPIRVAVPGRLEVALLDAAAFGSAAGDHAHMERTAAHEGPLTLDAYAVARILIGD